MFDTIRHINQCDISKNDIRTRIETLTFFVCVSNSKKYFQIFYTILLYNVSYLRIYPRVVHRVNNSRVSSSVGVRAKRLDWLLVTPAYKVFEIRNNPEICIINSEKSYRQSEYCYR
jgi:hypothetical protein